MNATLNIQDYLSEDEIKGILIGEYRAWLDTEIKENYGGWDNDHAFATADMGVLIYQAMLKGSEEV